MARRPLPRALVVLVLGGVLGAGLLAAPDPAAAAAAPACTDHQISLHLSRDTHDATQRYRFIVLTDTGGRCALQGRPAVSLEHRGRAVGVRGDYFPYSPGGGTPKVGTVTLAHRGQASIWLALAVANERRCRKEQIDGFLLRLPHQRVRRVDLPAGQRRSYAVCASRTSHELDFSQILPGAGR